MSEDQTTAQWLRAAVERVATGSSRICLVCARQLAQRLIGKGRAWKEVVTGWVGEAEGLNKAFRIAILIGGALILRKVGGGLVVALGHTVQSPSARWLLWPAAAVWIVAAYRIGHPEWAPKETADQTSTTDEPAGDPVEDATVEPDEPTVPAAPPVPAGPTLRDLHDALARIGTPHAHITALAEALGTTPELVRDALGKAGVAVEAVRMRGRGSSTGVRGGSIPTPLPAQKGTLTDVVAAGQPANNNDNNNEGVRAERGFWVEQDPANPVRHHVRHVA
ncbi:hypothetical protein [Streptomyces sp. NPDC060184]|uniref:hypothetical protein n=1 Tax=Streptomyces sp. NPDC060184 TaxID=3347064 RepID=UPI0036473541